MLCVTVDHLIVTQPLGCNNTLIELAGKAGTDLAAKTEAEVGRI